MYKEIKKNLKESDNPVLDTFINKYKPLYDTKPVMRNNALVADQISFRGSGIPKRVEATYTPGSLKVENEEWGFFVYNGEVDTDSMDNMSQYWFYDDYMNREDFKAKIDKAAKDLYNDMSKLYETMASNTEIQESIKESGRKRPVDWKNGGPRNREEYKEIKDDNYHILYKNHNTEGGLNLGPRNGSVGTFTKYRDPKGKIKELYNDFQPGATEEDLKKYASSLNKNGWKETKRRINAGEPLDDSDKGSVKEAEENDYSNKQGECPKCHESNLDYESIRLEGEMAYFPYKCNNCGQEGEEWYSMEFAGHNVYDEEGNLIEL